MSAALKTAAKYAAQDGRAARFVIDCAALKSARSARQLFLATMDMMRYRGVGKAIIRTLRE